MARCPCFWLRISPEINDLVSDVILKTNESDARFGGIQIDSEKAVRPNLPASSESKSGWIVADMQQIWGQWWLMSDRLAKSRQSPSSMATCASFTKHHPSLFLLASSCARRTLLLQCSYDNTIMSAAAAALSIDTVLYMSINLTTVHPYLVPSCTIVDTRATKGTKTSWTFLVITAKANGSKSFPTPVGAWINFVSTGFALASIFNAAIWNGLRLWMFKRVAMKEAVESCFEKWDFFSVVHTNRQCYNFNYGFFLRDKFLRQKVRMILL